MEPFYFHLVSPNLDIIRGRGSSKLSEEATGMREEAMKTTKTKSSRRTLFRGLFFRLLSTSSLVCLRFQELSWVEIQLILKLTDQPSPLVSKRVLRHRCLFKFRPRRAKKIQTRSKKAANQVTGALVACGEMNVRDDKVWGVVSGMEELNLVRGGR